MDITGSSARSGTSAGCSSCRHAWDDGINFSALSTGNGSEMDAVDEDKEIASQAVAFVIKSTRKGVVPLCADVAELLKVKQRLEKTVKVQQFEIQHLKSSIQLYSDCHSASSQTSSPKTSQPLGPICSSEVLPLIEGIERAAFSSHHSNFPAVSVGGMMGTSLVDKGLHTINTLISKAVQTSDEISAQISKTMVSKEVQVECLHFQMHKQCEEQLCQTLNLNSKLSEDLRNAWKQLEALHDRLSQAEDQWQQWQRANTHQSLSSASTLSCCEDFQPSNCKLALSCWKCSQPHLQNAQEEGKRKVVQNHKLYPDSTEVHVVSEGKARLDSPDFTVDPSCIRSVYSFPMVGCKCFSCAAFFSNHKHCIGKEIKKLLYLQRRKLQVNVNDYVTLNGNDSGTVLYIGHLNNSEMPNVVFVGVELDEPSGSHDGIFGGKRYFQCKENHGMFVPVHELFYVINRKERLTKKSTMMQHPHLLQRHHFQNSFATLHGHSTARSQLDPSSQPATQKKRVNSTNKHGQTKRLLKKTNTVPSRSPHELWNSGSRKPAENTPFSSRPYTMFVQNSSLIVPPSAEVKYKMHPVEKPGVPEKEKKASFKDYKSYQ